MTGLPLPRGTGGGSEWAAEREAGWNETGGRRTRSRLMKRKSLSRLRTGGDETRQLLGLCSWFESAVAVAAVGSGGSDALDSRDE